MKLVKHALAVGLLVASSSAMADTWLYAGAAAGSASFDENGDSDSATTYGVHVGTGILPIIGLEAGYWNHGEFEINQQKYDFDSIYAAIKPSVDLAGFHIYGRLGVHSYSGDVPAAAINDTDEDGYDLMYGVGVEYLIWDMFSLGVGYQNFEFDKVNIDSWTLNGTFHFL